MKQPLISVILPVYNGGKYLSESIESILNQTITDFELILINDGSTDNTESIIKSYNDERIVYIKNDKNQKLIKSLNIGVNAATGRYISRMDADDIAFPNLFERQIYIYNTIKDIDIVNIMSYILSENGLTYHKSNTSITVNHDVHQHIVFFQNLISHPGVMVKASLLKKYQYYDHESVLHFEDVDLWYRLLKNNYTCYTINEYLLFYRNTPTGVIHTQRNNRKINRINYCKKILETDYISLFTDLEIEIILGKFELVDLKQLTRLDKSLTKYISFVKSNKSISNNGLKDLFFWKTHLLFVTSVMALKHQYFLNKIGILFFIGLNLPLWLANRKWRIKLIEIIFNKKCTK